MTSKKALHNKEMVLTENLSMRSYITGLKLQHALLWLSSRDRGGTDGIAHSISH